MPDNTNVYFAKTDIDDSLNLLSDNGRVLNVVASAPSIEQARSLGYSLISEINFLGMQYRFDIGAKLTQIQIS